MFIVDLPTKFVALFATGIYIDRKLALTTVWLALYFPNDLIAQLFNTLSELRMGQDFTTLFEISPLL